MFLLETNIWAAEAYKKTEVFLISLPKHVIIERLKEAWNLIYGRFQQQQRRW